MRLCTQFKIPLLIKYNENEEKSQKLRLKKIIIFNPENRNLNKRFIVTDTDISLTDYKVNS